ncbi:MAG: hypothetical protein KBT03_02860 [Bacteroidales bacterium]|nr:hypothetical protein [Candidatus Scybalousia scybalohippi]
MEIEKMTEILKPFLQDFKTTDEIMDYLKVNGIDINKRAFQEYVILYNDNFELNRIYLASNSNGYKYTTDRGEIKQSLNQRLKKFVSGIKNIKKAYKVLGDYNQINLLDKSTDNLEAVAEEKPELYEEMKIGGVYW